MILGITSCENKSEETITKIKEYFTDNVTYTLDDIRVVDDGEEGFAVVYSISEPYSYDDFAPFVRQLVDTQVNFEKKKGLTYHMLIQLFEQETIHGLVGVIIRLYSMTKIHTP